MQQEYFKKHLSLSEWALQTNITNRNSFVKEDASKKNRLKFLNQAIGLPIVKTHSFAYEDISGPSSAFSSFSAQAGETPYALRATPKQEGLPVLRNRKLSVNELVNWLLASGTDFEKYDFSFEQHIEPEVAAIFIIESTRIVGEAIIGGILQLNTGLHAGQNFTYFEYDFQHWKFSGESTTTREFLERAIQYTYVSDLNKQVTVGRELSQAFSNNYLLGYYEAISSQASGIIFIDYNRVLRNNVEGIEFFGKELPSSDNLLRGQVGCAGVARGRARSVTEEEVQHISLAPDEILVCHFTSPEYVPLINQAAAVVTDVGGVLSHAAIVCRELRKPCVIGTRVGTQRITTGDHIEVNATEGIIRFL